MPTEPPDVIQGATLLCPMCATRERRRWGRSLRGYTGPISLLPNGDIVVVTPDAPRRMRAAFEILWRTHQRVLREAAEQAVDEGRACWLPWVTPPP